MFSSVFSRFSACRSSLVKLLSVREADCMVEATLLLMLSLADSGIVLSDETEPPQH